MSGALNLEMSLHTIRLYLEPNPGGIYTVTSPDVPGLVTEGRTPTEISNNVQEALDALVKAWRTLEFISFSKLARVRQTKAKHSTISNPTAKVVKKSDHASVPAMVLANKRL